VDFSHIPKFGILGCDMVLNWFEQELTTNQIRTPGSFPIQPPFQSIDKVPFQTIHNLNPYTGYHANHPLLKAYTPWRQQSSTIPYSGHLSKPYTISFRTWATFQSHPQSHSSRWVLTTSQTVLWVPFQTIHIPILYTRYLSKPSTFPCRTPGTNHSLFCTPGSFVIRPPSQSVHDVPCQASHNPIPYTGYQTKPL
jgi:hypothetical protein